MVGLFLKNHGKPEDARRYLKLALGLPGVSRMGAGEGEYDPPRLGRRLNVLKDALPKEGQTFVRWSVSADPPAVGSKAMADRWLDESVYS